MEDYNTKRYVDAMNRILSGLQMFVRDTNLSYETTSKYKIGTILREPTFCDTSRRVGGMITTHRYSILSNHFKDLSDFEFGTNWGLCVCNRDSHFKVLDIHEINNKTQILLLHLDEDWKLFENIKTNIEDNLVIECRQIFKNKCNDVTIPELEDGIWLDRCQYPIGINDNNEYFPLECT
jgi:hypothetical protein